MLPHHVNLYKERFYQKNTEHTFHNTEESDLNLYVGRISYCQLSR